MLGKYYVTTNRIEDMQKKIEWKSGMLKFEMEFSVMELIKQILELVAI